MFIEKACFCHRARGFNVPQSGHHHLSLNHEAIPGAKGQHSGGLFPPFRRRAEGQYLPFSPCELGEEACANLEQPGSSTTGTRQPGPSSLP